MPSTPPSLVQPGAAASLAERGVTAPFTTPALFGARVRGAGRHTLELVVPNPSGGRGAYVVTWEGLGVFCQPTVHDTQLAGRLRRLAELTPETVRDASWTVAAEGFAGPEAKTAADMARRTDRASFAAAKTALLTLLIRQATPLTPSDRLHHGGTGLTRDGAAAAIDALAVLFSPIGVGKDASLARLPRLIDRLNRLQQDTTRFAMVQRGDNGALAAAVTAEAAATIDCASALLNAQRGMARDMVGLLRRWSADLAGLAAEMGRTGWLLDGWEQIALLWSATRHPSEQHDALAQMAQLLPVLPAESDAWLGGQGRALEARRPPAPPPLPDRRPAFAVFERIARNEDLRGQAA